MRPCSNWEDNLFQLSDQSEKSYFLKLMHWREHRINRQLPEDGLPLEFALNFQRAKFFTLGNRKRNPPNTSKVSLAQDHNWYILIYIEISCSSLILYSSLLAFHSRKFLRKSLTKASKFDVRWRQSRAKSRHFKKILNLHSLPKLKLRS